VAGDHRAQLPILHELLAIAKAAGDADMLMEAYRQVGGASYGLGRLQDARTFFEAGLALYDPAQHERLAYHFGHDPAVTYLNFLGVVLWLLGYPEQALGHSQRLLGLLPSLSHPTSVAYAHCALATHACVRRDSQAAGLYAEEAIRLGRAHRLASWVAWGSVLLGWARVEQGQDGGGLAQLKEGIAAWRAMGWGHYVPHFLALYAETCLKTHQLQEAAEALTAARATAQNGGDAYWSAEVDRLHGELSLEGDDEVGAEAFFRSALATAREQGARMLELRAAMGLARLWQIQGKAEAGRETLGSVYSTFTEGFATADLLSAAALLKSLTVQPG
jgi:predicted ATPase